MYKRERRQHFDERIRQMNAEKRLTDNQKEWEEEAYKLNNRLADAEKRGYRFEDNIIPDRPSRVTKSDIEYLKQINRHKFKDYATSIDYDNEEDIQENDYSEPEPEDYSYQDTDEYNDDEYDYDNDEEDDEEQDDSWWDNYDEDNYSDDYESERYNPQDDYYKNTDRDYDNDFPPTEGYTVIENIRQMFGRQTYVIEADKWSTSENLRIKYDAASKISLALRVAVEELGEDAVARGIQSVGAKVVNDAADVALFLMYRDETYTERRTSAAIETVINAFFAADPSKKMTYDYYQDEDDSDL